MDAGVLIVIGGVLLAYALLGLALRNRRQYDGSDTRPLAAFPQARRDAFVRLSRPLGIVGPILLCAGVLLLVTGA